MIATADTPVTSVILVTGDNLLATKNGSLLIKDALLLLTTGAGSFSSNETITVGTGEWAGAQGTLHTFGNLTGTVGC